jgi:hypothetical protein
MASTGAWSIFASVKAVEKVNPDRSGCRNANTEAACELRVGTGHEGRSLFMPYVDETDLILVFAKSFKYAIDTVTRQTKTVFTPHASKRSTRTSDASVIILSMKGSRAGATDSQRRSSDR